MGVLSFEKIIGIITTFIVISIASGHGEWVWKTIAQAQHIAFQQIDKPWGCPSAFNKNACNEYDPSRYK